MMKESDGRRQCVSRMIRLRDFLQTQKEAYHFLYLFFFGTAGPDNRLLYCNRRKFTDGQGWSPAGDTRSAAGNPGAQSTLCSAEAGGPYFRIKGR